MITEWTGLKVCAPCLDPLPPQILPPDVYPEGIPFMDARPPQDNPDRLTDDTYLQAVVGGMVDTDGTYPIYPDGQQTPLGGLSPQSIIVDPIPKNTPKRDLVADLVTLRTGPVYAPTAGQQAAPSDPSSSPVTAVTPPAPTPPDGSPFTPPGAPPPLSLVVTPETQQVTRSGAGSAVASVSYTASGGVPPYAYSTSAHGLTITGGTTINPTVMASLIAGQDTSFAITGTLTDSAGTTPATATAAVEFIATAPPALQLIIAPTTQVITRVGTGAVSAGVTYAASGGVPPYGYSTSAPGLTVTGGTTTAPTVSTTLSSGDDTTFSVTGTLTDSAGTTPVDATASVEFKATAVPLALVVTPGTQRVTRSGTGALAANLSYTASGGVPPYGYATSAPGLTITNGTTTTPQVSATLTAGDDNTYTVTGTLTDSVGTTPTTATAAVELVAIAPPLSLIIAPATQRVTRSGAGSISTGVTYTASGGLAPYGYTTSAPGLSVSGGTTTTPTLSTTLAAGQDTTFTVTGTLTDSLGSTPATASSSVEFVASVPVVGLALSVAPATQIISRSGAGSVSTTLTYTATGGVAPYTYSTSAPGLTVTGGTTTTPGVSTSLTNGQDTTFTVTGTVTDSASTVAHGAASVEFQSIVPPMSLAVAPATSLVTRSGSGAVSQTLTYTVTGGLAPYTYSTSAPGLTVTGGTTTTPTVSTSILGGQDTTYPITATVIDARGNQATGTASVEFKSLVSPLVLTVAPGTQTITRSGAGAVSTTLTYTASGGAAPYFFTTSAPGLTIANGSSSLPTVSTTLTNGQDTTFAVTGHVTDSQFTPATTTGTASVEFKSIVPALTLTALPASQIVSRVGPGSVSAGITYAAGGGAPPYTYTTSAPGLTVASGATTAPTVSVTLTDGQDTTYTVTGTVHDSLGTTPATASASVEFLATPLPAPPPFDPMLALANGINADSIGIEVRGSYTNVVYAPTDMQVYRNLGVTYFRIPMDISYIMPGLPISGGGGALSTTATCAAVLTHIDAVMSLMASFGFVLVPVLFVDKDLRVARGNAGTFNSMMTDAMTFMAGRWMNPASPTYYSPTQLILNICNEPRYGPTQGFAYTLWSDPLDNTAGLMPLMIAAVRAVSKAHTLLIDTVGLAKPENLAFQGISPDQNVVYSCHIYNPAGLTQIGTAGTPLDQWYLYPGRGEIIGPPPPSNFLIAPSQYNLPPLKWLTGTHLTAKNQKQKYLSDKFGNPQYGSLPGAIPVVKPIIEDYWTSEITTATLTAYIQSVRTWATSHSVRVIIGEFGVTNDAPYASRLQWIQDVVSTCHTYSLPRSWWSTLSTTFGIRPKGDLTSSNAVIDTDPASPTFRYDLDLLRLLKFTGV